MSSSRKSKRVGVRGLARFAKTATIALYSWRSMGISCWWSSGVIRDTNCFPPKTVRNAMQKAGRRGDSPHAAVAEQPGVVTADMDAVAAAVGAGLVAEGPVGAAPAPCHPGCRPTSRWLHAGARPYRNAARSASPSGPLADHHHPQLSYHSLVVPRL